MTEELEDLAEMKRVVDESNQKLTKLSEEMATKVLAPEVVLPCSE
jgi:hypothetical protein